MSPMDCWKRGWRRIENHIKRVDSKDNLVNIMFRPTYFVILFAVVLCANAIPAPLSSLAPEGPGRTEEIGKLRSPSPKLPAPGSEGEGGPDKGDLNTDATTHWRYTYDGPRWGYAPSYSQRSSGWGFGFGKLYPTWQHYLY